MKIRIRIILTFLGLFTIIMALVGLATGITSAQTYNQKTKDSLLALTDSKADHIRTLLTSEKEETAMMAASQVLRDFLKTEPDTTEYTQQAERSMTRLKRTIETNPEIFEYLLIDKNGKILLSTAETPIGADKSQDLFFSEAQKDVYLKDFYFSEALKKNIYTISAPIKDDQTGGLLGVIVARLLPNEIYEIVAEKTGLGQTGENFLVNAQKLFITPSLYLGEEVILKQKLETQNMADCFNPQEIASAQKDQETAHAGEAVQKYKDYRGVNILGTHAYIPETGWCLVGKIDYKEVNRPAVIQALIFSGIFVISAFFFILVGLMISKRISEPLEKLSVGATKIAQGDLSYKIATDDKDEIGHLSRDFSQMVKAIIASRAEVDRKVHEQTFEIVAKQQDLHDQQKAVLNILEDVEIEKELTAKEKNKISTILQSIGDAVFVVDTNYKIVLVNHVTLELLELNEEEVIGKKYSDVLKFVFEESGKVNDAFITKAIESKAIQEMSNHTVLINKKGERIPVNDSAAPLLGKDGQVEGCVVVFRDISKEYAIDKAKSEFVSLASHQLRTPLSAINWYAEMLINGDVGKLTPDQLKYMGEIYKGNQRMVDLVNALLDVSRIELGTFAISPEAINIVNLAKDIVKETKLLADQKKIVLTENYDKNLPEISADSKLVQIIFQNLLSNAVKYTPEKGKVTLTITKKDPNILIEVADTGYGIPKAQQTHIYEKLFRADNVRAKDTEGTGLGLYIVKAIVEQSNGKISFKSAENKGTTFYVEIPLKGMPKKEGTKALEDIK